FPGRGDDADDHRPHRGLRGFRQGRARFAPPVAPARQDDRRPHRKPRRHPARTPEGQGLEQPFLGAHSRSVPAIVFHSVVPAEAQGAVVVNASHGGIYAAYLAAKLGAAAAIFNDAGVGHDRAGIAGLDYLQDLGIAAATIGHDTARIGDGADMMARGVITHANTLAQALACRPGMPCRDAAAALQSAEPARPEPPPALEAAFLVISDAPQVWALDSASLVAP